MDLVIRPGRPADVPAVLGLLEGAARWLVARGRTGQWGTAPQATDPRRIEAARRWARSGGLYIAEIGGRAVGALAVGIQPTYVPPAIEPELYVTFLASDRAYAGRGIGAALLEHAAFLARSRGVALLRVDCYGGDDRALVRFYENAGFTATESFTVELPRGPWPGQILVRRLA